MIVRTILLFLLWLVLRRIWRSFVAPKPRRPAAGSRPAYPGPETKSSKPEDMNDLTQQKISDAEFEELDSD